MPIFAHMPLATKATNKRERNRCSNATALPARKQPKTSTIASPTFPSPSKNMQRFKSRKLLHSNPDSSLKTILESHLNTPLDPWVADLNKRVSIPQQKQRLQPSTTYIYMQLATENPNSYVCVPLPPSMVAQMTTPPTPRASPGPLAVTEDEIEAPPLPIDTEAWTTLQTPPRTPRMSIVDTVISED